MNFRFVVGGLVLAMSASVFAADAPSGWAKCVQNTGATCTLPAGGTYQVTMGKNNVFAAYQNVSGSFVCAAATFPDVATSVSGSASAWCSYNPTAVSGASSSAASSARYRSTRRQDAER